MGVLVLVLRVTDFWGGVGVCAVDFGFVWGWYNTGLYGAGCGLVVVWLLCFGFGFCYFCVLDWWDGLLDCCDRLVWLFTVSGWCLW